MIQVGYFKATRKRFLRCSIHHHFEQCGWPETRVVLFFGYNSCLAWIV
ncbi:hypothetical protein [Clostridioides difficile]|nr:hypothetical protein [Clostridioides difficile]